MASPVSRTTFRVLVITDEPMAAIGVRDVLERDGHFTVVGVAPDGPAALPMVNGLSPDLLLLDVDVGTPAAQAAVRTLTAAAPILLHVGSVTPEQMRDVFRWGATGVLLKSSAPDVLCQAARAVAEGKYWVAGEELARMLAARPSRSSAETRPFGLTERELQVTRLLGEGYANREIAATLLISEDTVKHHLTRAFDKTGTSSRVELAIFAIHHLKSVEST